MSQRTDMPDSLSPSIARTALAFRGYNTENLGRSTELLRDSRYTVLVEESLADASQHAERWLQRKVDLLSYVDQAREFTLEQYGEAVAFIMGMAQAQLRCLAEVHDVAWPECQLMLGYSLGEVSALVAAGGLSLRDAMLAPLTLADDCVALSDDVTLGVLFSRRDMLDMEAVGRAALETNMESQGSQVVGVSALLSPNSLLVMGQGDSLDRFVARLKESLATRIYLRKNPNPWPPLHTPIVWQKNIPSRAAQLMWSMEGGLGPFNTPVLSLVDGQIYTGLDIRSKLYRWVDQRQLLWEGVCELFNRDVETVVHVGPQPNIIPATLRRISDNVAQQTKSNIRIRALARLANRPWLKSILPQRTALLRAPQLRQIVLEDWLLEH